MILLFYSFQYHGTSKSIAGSMLPGRISVDIGGGELGKGFYTGNLLYKAFNWAEKKYGKKDMCVIALEYNDYEFLKLNTLLLNQKQAIHVRLSIKKRNLTRSFVFRRDAIKAPVVGKIIHDFNQIKYESKSAETHINKKSYFLL